MLRISINSFALTLCQPSIPLLPPQTLVLSNVTVFPGLHFEGNTIQCTTLILLLAQQMRMNLIWHTAEMLLQM
jgi:hypothetical protein